MKIRIYETDFEGHPVECTGEYFSGPTALAIVECMKMDPFNASLEPLEYMRKVLEAIGQQKIVLPMVPEQAAEKFLQILAENKYAVFIDTDAPDYFSYPCESDEKL